MPIQGQDVEADLLVTLEEALSGSTRQISFRRGASGKIQTYTVRIPKGVREGQRIRLAGLGESVGEGGQAGDLYLRVKFEKHPEFDVEGSDIFYELEIPAWQAVLGGDVEIPTLDGRAKLHVPPGSQNGQKFRLAGRGLPQKGGGRGNFYAVLRKKFPARSGRSRQRTLEANRFPGTGSPELRFRLRHPRHFVRSRIAVRYPPKWFALDGLLSFRPSHSFKPSRKEDNGFECPSRRFAS